MSNTGANAPADLATNTNYLQTLSSITSTKTSIFSYQQAAFKEYKNDLLKSLPQGAECSVIVQRIHKLIDGMSLHDTKSETQEKRQDVEETATADADDDENRQKLFSHLLAQNTQALDTPESSLMRITRLLASGELDPAVSGNKELLSGWEMELINQLERQERRMEVASLIGKIVAEWVATSKKLQAVKDRTELDATVQAQAQAKTEHVDTFKSLVFSPHPLDSDPGNQIRIKEYLDKIFKNTPEASGFLNRLRQEFKENSLPSTWVSKYSLPYLKDLVQSLANSDVLTNGKRSFLKNHIVNNSTVLNEILDVLRMKTPDIASWTWQTAGLGGSEDGIMLKPRFYINGKYRIYMDIDPMTALFVHHIGLCLSDVLKVQSKAAFYPHVAAWAGGQGKLLDMELATKLRKCFANDIPDEDDTTATIDAIRRGYQRDTFFLNHLPKPAKFNVRKTGYGGAQEEDDDSEAEFEEDGDNQKPLGKQVKEQMLDFCMAELRLARALSMQGGSKSFTIVVSDFKWFGPSLSHKTLATVMRYFGFTRDMVKFLERYLAAPCYFEGEDPTPENIKTRVRGVPPGQPFCDMAAELVLFCIDFAVNQVSDGDVFLYRCFDDLWFWSDDQTKCELVWAELQKVAKIFGLEFNMEKTGSACFNFSDDGEIIPGEIGDNLPKGSVKWGLLELTPNGILGPDPEAVNLHITELTRQLSSPACKMSILSFTTSWNRYYATFLPYHFAPPSFALGRDHSSMVVKQLAHIQSEVLKRLNSGNPITLVDYLRKEITDRFSGSGVDMIWEEIPESWFYWPHHLGGLGIKNPIINYASHLMPCAGSENGNQAFDKEIETDKRTFRLARAAWRREVKASTSSLFRLEGSSHSGSRPGRGRGARGRGRGRDARVVYSSYRNENDDIPDEFLTEKEYSSPEARQKFHRHWAEAYAALLDTESNLLPPPGLPAALQKFQTFLSTGEVDQVSSWSKYWKSVFSLYGLNVVEKWGGMKLVQREWVPTGLLQGARELRGGWAEL